MWMAAILGATIQWGAVATARAGPAPDAGVELTGGFRMEGDPKIETVFGDAEQFRRYVDRFYSVHGEMQKTREDFSRNVQAVLASLAANQAGPGRAPRVCPVDAVALTYARAY